MLYKPRSKGVPNWLSGGKGDEHDRDGNDWGKAKEYARVHVIPEVLYDIRTNHWVSVKKKDTKYDKISSVGLYTLQWKLETGDEPEFGEVVKINKRDWIEDEKVNWVTELQKYSEPLKRLPKLTSRVSTPWRRDGTDAQLQIVRYMQPHFFSHRETHNKENTRLLCQCLYNNQAMLKRILFKTIRSTEPVDWLQPLLEGLDAGYAYDLYISNPDGDESFNILHYAAYNNQTSAVVEILEHFPGLEEEFTSTGRTALEVATAEGHCDVVEALGGDMPKENMCIRALKYVGLAEHEETPKLKF